MPVNIINEWLSQYGDDLHEEDSELGHEKSLELQLTSDFLAKQ